MSDKTIRLLIDLTYNQDIMHGDDEEAIKWFNEDILLGDNLQLGDFGDIGDMIGSVKVVSYAVDRIKDLDAENKRLKSLIVDVINDTGDDPEIMAASRAEWARRARVAEARLATCEKYIDAYDKMARFLVEAGRDFEVENDKLKAKMAKVQAQLEKIAEVDTQAWAMSALADIKGEKL